MEVVKHSPEAAVSYGLLSGIGLTPADVEKQVIDFFTAKASAVMTNVPGPREPVHMAGVRVAGVIPWVPRSGDIPIGLSIFSYAGQVVVGLAVDAALVPEPEAILTGMEEQLRTLQRLSAPAASRPAPPRADLDRAPWRPRHPAAGGFGPFARTRCGRWADD